MITSFGPSDTSGAVCIERGRRQAPVYHLGFPIGVGPRVDDIMATAIPGFYMSPYEDLKLRRP